MVYKQLFFFYYDNGKVSSEGTMRMVNLMGIGKTIIKTEILKMKETG